MKIKGRDSGTWHKTINDTVGRRKPTDADFPWIALANVTGYYLKKKGKLSQIEIDERLLALIQNHPSKEVAIAASAHIVSTRTIRELLVNGFRVEPDGALGIEEYVQVIIATSCVNPTAVNEIEVKWARYLWEHAPARGSFRTLAQQLRDVLSLQPTWTGPDLLLQDHIKRLAVSLCKKFSMQLQELGHRSQWMDAHGVLGWLSTASTSSNTDNTMDAVTRNLLDTYLPRWRAWAVWRPDILRLGAWKGLTTCAHSSLEDLLALEGPDFARAVGSEQATLREGLIAQGSRGSQSTLQWGKTHVSFGKNPFKEFESLNGILRRLTNVIDFACSAGPEYTDLLAHLCKVKTVSNEVLQILEGAKILGEPDFTKVIRQVFTVPRQSFGEEEISGVRRLLPALGDSRLCDLRQQMQPHIVIIISEYVRGLQNTLFMHLSAGNEWIDAAKKLLVFTHGLQEETWLVAELDFDVQQVIASAPSLIMMETLDDVRKSVCRMTTSTPTPLLSQIDAYCKAQLLPHCTTDSQSRGLVEALISLWQQDSDRNHRLLALLIADLPKTGCQFRCDCLKDIPTLNSIWVIRILEALDFHDGSSALGCIALIRFLASEKRMDIVERWRKVLSFAIEKQNENLLRHAVTHLTADMWLQLLSCIRVVYRGSGVITEHRSRRLLSVELHVWSEQLANYLPTLTRLESVLGRGPAMQTLLLGPANSKNHQLRRVLDLVKDSVSSTHAKVMDNIIALLHSGNAGEIEDALAVVSQATLKGAGACLGLLDSRGQVHRKLAEVESAISLRADDCTEPDCLALRRVARLLGIDLDNDKYKTVLREAANSVHERYLRLMAEARRLENLRLSLQAVAPESVSELLVKFHIEAPAIVDDTLACLPSSLGSLVERISKNEIELQFPATELTRLQRFAIGAGDAESFLVRLTLGNNGAPIKFCIHLSVESSDQMNSKVSSNEKGHTPWEVFRSTDRPPYEQYCRGRPNLGAYQLSRIMWRHLRHDFRSLEQTHTYMTSKIASFGKGCAVCGRGQRRLRRATICSLPSCQSTFLRAPIKIQLAAIWQDPPVMDLLLSMIHATASTGKLSPSIDCPAINATAVVSMLDGLPAIPTLAIHLGKCLNTHGNNFRLAQALVRYCTQASISASLAQGLLWVCVSYRGFLVSAIGPQRIPSFGNNQFLLANAIPDLEFAFSRHMQTPQSTSQILFHGTSLDRLHAILCQGLRVQSGTNLQRHGAAHGAGIYMADEPTVAWGYATASTGGWKSSKLKDMKLLLGCELAGPKPLAALGGIYVITDALRLAVRYVFLLASDARMPAAKDVRIPMASVFQKMRNDTL